MTGSTKRLTIVERLGEWDIGLWGLEGEGCCIGKELVLEMLAEEKVGRVSRLTVDGAIETVCEVQWELGGKRCDGDKGEGTNTAGSTKRLTVIGLLGD
jgi:hypothetical protein